MDRADLDKHISSRFNQELGDIRSRVLAMGGLVEQQLGDAMRALLHCDGELAEQVVVGDYRVNAMEVSIDEECIQILALRQPAASDLRLVVAVVKTIADLERCGDEAERIARFALDLQGARCKLDAFADIEHLGNHVRGMLRDALDALARMDVEAALKVAKEDRMVDREYEGIMRQMITYMMEDPRSIPVCLDITWCARALERVGDRCCNISEYIIYLVKGKDVRHITLDEMEKEVLGKN